MNKTDLTSVRHSLSHLMTLAITEMFPGVGLGVGPWIEDGFYQDYDFDLAGQKFEENLLPEIEKKIKAYLKQGLTFEKSEHPIKEALAMSKDDPYKTELIHDLDKAGNKTVSFYQCGSLVNLCAGPHVQSTQEIDPNAFKLTRVAGSYWKGDEKNKMLTRIYGIAFENKAALEEYLRLQEEAEKRDHRKLGKELDLFHIDSQVGLGLPLWHPKGAMLWRVIEDFWYQEHLRNGYELVRTPHIGSKLLWETSGHWNFYNSSMYPPLEVGQTLEEKQKQTKVKESEEYLLKPMNCPFHVQIYKNSPRSYKDLPLRWAECGTVYRYEKKGELSGLTRVRGFTQDDAHIICRDDQVEEELKKVIDFILFIFKSFGFNLQDLHVYLAVRDPGSNKYAGNDAGWSFTEQVLEKVAKAKKLHYDKDVGGAVFYGPKLDFKIKDCLKREWQCSTLQFDFNLPARFDLKYIDTDGHEKQPYMLHRALFGSYERFIGLLIEHYAGAFPVWLAPVQARIIPVSDKFLEYAKDLNGQLRDKNIRTELDDTSESVGKKIRNAEMMKVPYMLVVGEKEVADKTVSVRDYHTKQQVTEKIDQFIARILEEISSRQLPKSEEIE
ncbi:threonine--tRNA ligase [Candidatus Peregrinibacteria bacterium CG08_land_8_20_14_0_20_41_10]|nr:MAG: threonine--tRNA ligase [Candidatus Peregrinibacteria bacterium CG08_land_8_20_14_0_20_41_10]